MPECTVRNVTLRPAGRATPGDCRVIVPIMPPVPDEAAALAACAGAEADLIEVRLDALGDLTAEACRQTLAAVRGAVGGLPLLATVRTRREGGPAPLSPEGYAALLCALCADGAADLVDVELSAGPMAVGAVAAAAGAAGVGTVFSFHDFGGTPPVETLLSTLQAMRRQGAGVAKIAVTPTRPGDPARLLEAAERFAAACPDQPMIALSMGAAGVMTRICAGAFGSCATFGAVGQTSAPGQPPAGKLRTAMAALDEIIKNKE